jgi:sugar phosphate isomerase/epimerase
LAQLGYDCVEICLEAPDVRPELLDDKRCTELRQMLHDLGIAVASLSYHGDNEPPPERAANQEHAIFAAQRLGVGILVINSERIVERERQWAEHVDHFKRLCQVAAGQGVTVAVEPEPKMVVGSSQEMIEMLHLVDSPHFKVNLDIGHAQVCPSVASKQFTVEDFIHPQPERICNAHVYDAENHTGHIPPRSLEVIRDRLDVISNLPLCDWWVLELREEAALLTTLEFIKEFFAQPQEDVARVGSDAATALCPSTEPDGDNQTMNKESNYANTS